MLDNELMNLSSLFSALYFHFYLMYDFVSYLNFQQNWLDIIEIILVQQNQI